MTEEHKSSTSCRDPDTIWPKTKESHWKTTAGPSAPQGEFHQSPPSHQWTGWCVSSGALGEIQCIWKQQDDASLIDKRCHDRTHVARQLSCMSVRLVQNSSKVSRVRKYIMQVRFPKIGVPQIIQVMNDHSSKKPMVLGYPFEETSWPCGHE